MPLDKELYRKAYESLRQWNEAELIDRVRNAGELSPAQAWEQYVGLWEFALRHSPPQSELGRKQRLTYWQEYYANIRKLEAWRRARGKTA